MATKKPENTGASAPEPRSSDSFVREELAAAQQAWNRTKIYGTIVFIVLAIETIAVSTRFALALQPHDAAVIASGFISTQLDEHSDAIRDGIAQRVPEMIEKSPDYVIEQLPSYRVALEDKVNTSLSTYVKSTSDSLGTHMDDYIDQNKTEIQTVLSSSDPNAISALGPSLRTEIEAYLKEKPASGESVQDQIDQSLGMLKDIQGKMDHLANGSNLSPTDLQTRHALAVIASSVTRENLQPIPIKDVLPQPSEADASGAASAAPAAVPSAPHAPGTSPVPPVPHAAGSAPAVPAPTGH
jgi:hypothetical protein